MVNLFWNKTRTKIKNILPYFLTSICVVGLWYSLTSTSNYAWFPKGKDRLMLDIALLSIFYYKTLFWLVVANFTTFTVLQLKKTNYKTSILCSISITAFYLLVGQLIDKKCASYYYSVFHNQSVSEEYIDSPIVKAGYQIGTILTENIASKDMKYRRYAINGLEKIKYIPATFELNKILLDKSELDIFRADAFQALTIFDTDETRKLTYAFREQATDPLDKRVIELTDYWTKRK